MLRYILHRLISLLPVLFVMSIITFSFLHLLPGDPVDLMLGETATGEQRHTLFAELGLDRPLYIQYLTWMKNILTGNFGNSVITHKPVLDTILEKLPASLLLASTASFLALLMALVLGTFAAAHRGTLRDIVVLIVSLLGVSVPIFWLGIILVLFFSVQLPLFPSIGYVDISNNFFKGLHHLVLPSITLAANMAGAVMRLTRTEMIEQLGKDYVTTAWAKGLPRRSILYKHALKNALIPVVTLTGLQLGYQIGGALVVETIFGWPGVGSLLMYSILARDYIMAQGIILFLAFAFTLVNLLVDISYTFLNPQIGLGTQS